MKTVEGTVDDVQKSEDGKKDSITVAGQKWYCSVPRYRDNWYEARKGDTVRLTLDPWNKSDGTVAYSVKAIENINGFTEAETLVNDITTPYLGRRGTTDRSIEKQVCLKAAVDTAITAFVDSDIDARIDMVLKAYAAFSGAIAQD